MLQSEIDSAANQAATSPKNDLPEPTTEQIKAGNYAKGHVTIHGLNIAIENPKGSTRSGVSASGKAWKILMKQHYGYIKRSEGADDDHVDVFIGDKPESEKVFVVNQVNPETGAFDEHKCMLCFEDREEASEAYLSNYEKGWQGMKSMISMDVEKFKDWLKNGDTKMILESSNSWVGVDLDGTLAVYDGWKGEDHVGEPVPLMMERVKELIQYGETVKIFTARAESESGKKVVEKWLAEHGLQGIEVTNIKDSGMTMLLDDRAKNVIPNTGVVLESFDKKQMDDIILEMAESEWRAKLAQSNDIDDISEVFRALFNEPPSSGSPFFKDTFTSQLVSLDKLVAREEPNPERVKRAHAKMSAAKGGTGEKRAPVRVFDMGNGKFKVLDGNTTLQALKELGETEVVVEVKKSLKQQVSNPSSLDDVYEQAGNALPTFKEWVEAYGRKTGGRVMLRPGLKGKDRAAEKVKHDYNGTASRLTDIIGGMIVFDSVEDVVTAFNLISKDPAVYKCKNRFENPTDDGYRDVLMVVNVGGHLCELQLNTEGIIEAKERGLGHKLYEVTRQLIPIAKDENNGDFAFMAMGYIESFRKISVKLYRNAAMSSSISSASNMASDSEIEEEYKRILQQLSASSISAHFSIDLPSILKTQPVNFSIAKGTSSFSTNLKLSDSISVPPFDTKNITRNGKNVKANVVTGRMTRAYLNDGTVLKLQYAVVDADDLVTSHNTDFTLHPEFPQELQPRDRTRDTMRQQIASIAGKLNPDLLGGSLYASVGSPIVGRDLVVESGNGRTMGIKTRYERDEAPHYREWLIDEAASKIGINPETVKDMNRPVLVRIRLSDESRTTVTERANEGDIASMSPVEQAKVDDRRLTGDDMDIFRPSDDGDITAASNRQFVNKFITLLGPAEAAGLLTADSRPTKKLVDRIQAAIFSKAYANDKLLALMAEETHPTIKNILTALTLASPVFAKIRGIAPGMGGIDLTDHVVGAAMLILKSRDESEPIEMILKQLGMFDQIPEETKAVARLLHANMRSAKRMGNVFKLAGQKILTYLQNRDQISMFGAPEKPTAAGVLKEALSGEEAEGVKQRGLFESAGDAPNIDNLRVVVSIANDQTPKDIPENWIVFNAPRPLYGHKDWQGEFGHGRFYAAVDPDGDRAAWMIEQNKSLDGWIYQDIDTDTMQAIVRQKYIEYMKGDTDKVDGILANADQGQIRDSFFNMLEKMDYGQFKALLAAGRYKKPVSVEPEPKPGKEPWQMTPDEFVGETKNLDEISIVKTAHVQHTKKAVEDGKKVPLHVLEKYRHNTWAKKAIDAANGRSFEPWRWGILEAETMNDIERVFGDVFGVYLDDDPVLESTPIFERVPETWQQEIQNAENMEDIEAVFKREFPGSFPTPPPNSGKTEYVDTGEKIGGARKDIWAAIMEGRHTLNVQDMEGMDSETASKLVTKTNVIQNVVDQFLDHDFEPGSVFMITRLFGSYAAKPDDTDQARANYVAAASKVNTYLRTAKTLDDFKEVLKQIRAEMHGVTMTPEQKAFDDDYKERSKAYSEMSSKKWSELIRDPKYHSSRPGNKFKRDAAETEYSKFRDEIRKELFPGDIHKKHYEMMGMLNEQAEAYPNSARNQYRALGDRFINAVFLKSDAFKKNLYEAKSITDYKWLEKESGKKIDREKVEKPKWTRFVPDSPERSGGADRVFKPQDLIDTFGIRGVEYGNWMDRESSEHHTQMLGLSFMDLSDILGIPVNHVSHGGKLAIAFGSRGSGNASAHYEPGKKAINMTKFKGGGSLAHEWGHFMDNIVNMVASGGQEQFSFATGNIAERKAYYSKRGLAKRGLSPLREGDSESDQLGSGIPQSVKIALVQLHSAINQGSAGGKSSDAAKNKYRSIRWVDSAIAQGTDPQKIMDDAYLKDVRGKFMGKLNYSEVSHYIHDKTGQQVLYDKKSSEFYARSAAMSKSADNYWTRPHELFARAFEAYISDKLEAGGRSNSYLVSGVNEGRLAGYSPYPMGEERKQINLAFDRLIEALKENQIFEMALLMSNSVEGEGMVLEDARDVSYTIDGIGRKWLQAHVADKPNWKAQIEKNETSKDFEVGKTYQFKADVQIETSKFGRKVQVFPFNPGGDRANQARQEEIKRWLGYVEEKAGQYVYQKGVDKLKELKIEDFPELQQRLDAAMEKTTAATRLAKEKRAQSEIERWLGYIEEKSAIGKIYYNGLEKVASLGIEKFPELKARLDAAKEQAKSVQESQSREEEAERKAKAKQESDSGIISLSGGSGYGHTGWQEGQIIHKKSDDGTIRIYRVTSTSKQYFREDGLSFGVGDDSGYIYRAEAAPVQDDDNEAIQYRQKLANKDIEKAQKSSISKIARYIKDNGEIPPGNDNQPEGEKYHNTQSIYGGGEWFVVGKEWIWYVENNGMDGDDWSRNNIRTGGAGAIGWRMRYSDGLANAIMNKTVSREMVVDMIKAAKTVDDISRAFEMYFQKEIASAKYAAGETVKTPNDNKDEKYMAILKSMIKDKFDTLSDLTSLHFIEGIFKNRHDIDDYNGLIHWLYSKKDILKPKFKQSVEDELGRIGRQSGRGDLDASEGGYQEYRV